MARHVGKSTHSHAYEHIRHEHQELASMFKRVRKTIAEGADNVEPIAELFDELLDLIEQHFTHEEEGGYFREVVEMAPRLEPTVAKLHAEHAILLKMLRATNQSAQRRLGTTEWWTNISKEFDIFVRRCGEHESHENRLVQDAYTQDIGAQD